VWDPVSDPGGDDLTGSNDGLEYPCQNCGGFVPSNAKRCPHCGTAVDAEEESVEAILEELTTLLHDGDEDEEGEEGVHRGEGPPDEAQEDSDNASSGPERKVRYKKVRNWPP
jgi:hypothetical protein